MMNHRIPLFRYLRTDGLFYRTRTTVMADAVDPKINAKPFNEIPKIPSLPIIGSLWTLLPIIGKYDFRNMIEASQLKYKEYGKIVAEDFSSFNKVVHVFDPADFEQVFRSEGRYPERPPFQSVLKMIKNNEDILSLGMGSTNGEDWWRIRSKVQPHMMKPRTTANYLPSVDLVAKEFIQRMKFLRDKGTLEIDNLEDELRRFALESIGLVALDTRLGCLSLDSPLDSDTKLIFKFTSEFLDSIFKLEFKSPWWRLYPTALFKEMESSLVEFTKISQKYLAQAQSRLEKQEKDQTEMTILELLLSNNVDSKDIAITMNDLISAGVEMTYITCGFFLYHMSKYPEVEKKLREEIDRLLPEKNSPITIEVLNEARYLKACVKESMRLCPAAAGSFRKIKKDTVLAGYMVPAETQVVLNGVVAAHDEKNFPEPMKFRPERWLRENKESREINPFAFLPFGFGSRSCVGRRIAEQEIYTLILRILQNFHVEYHHEDIGIYCRMINYPDKSLRFAFHDLK